MKITDKIIEDIIRIHSVYSDTYKIPQETINEVKKELKEKGYEVEELKSKLEEARSYNLVEHTCDAINRREIGRSLFRFIDKDEVELKIALYEEAITELQEQIEKMKCCYNCKYLLGVGYCKYDSQKEKRCGENYSLWELEERT